MIIKDGDNVLVECDICKTKEFWMKNIQAELVKSYLLPEGWEGFIQSNVTKMLFCPKKECRKILDILDK